MLDIPSTKLDPPCYVPEAHSILPGRVTNAIQYIYTFILLPGILTIWYKYEVIDIVLTIPGYINMDEWHSRLFIQYHSNGRWGNASNTHKEMGVKTSKGRGQFWSKTNFYKMQVSYLFGCSLAVWFLPGCLLRLGFSVRSKQTTAESLQVWSNCQDLAGDSARETTKSTIIIPLRCFYHMPKRLRRVKVFTYK